ncbi:MAG: 30S ribosomal protein S18 [Candidatus Dadabacteria bacterium]|nr:MAG: 30S ribosomal protein S18 [Candidatus Dadabacteria bacterium]
MAKDSVFVSNLDFSVTEEDLRKFFSEVAEPLKITIAYKREKKRSRGFAFITMPSEADAKKAIEVLNGKKLKEREIKVEEDKSTKKPSVPSDKAAKKEVLPPIKKMTLFKRKKKLDPFLTDPNKVVDYRDIATLSRFITERGKIMPRRLTGLTAYHQRQVAKAIKRARQLGLMPYIVQ